MVVGLAPGLGGAGRTGRGFVGDASGAFLFDSLYGSGLPLTSGQNRALARYGDLPHRLIARWAGKRNCEKFLCELNALRLVVVQEIA